jgi:NADP-reducing hydrogenase subunit HndA
MLPSERYKKPQAGAVLNALHEITTLHGYLPQDQLIQAASDLAIPLSQLYSAATFYASFSFRPPGKYKLQVCEGTACYIKGAVELLEYLEKELDLELDETTQDLLFTLKKVHCVGSCGLAPVVRVDEDTFGRLDINEVENLLATYRQENALEEMP